MRLQMASDPDHLPCFEYREGRPALFGHYPPPPRRVYWPEEQPPRIFVHIPKRVPLEPVYKPQVVKFPERKHDYTIAVSAGW